MLAKLSGNAAITYSSSFRGPDFQQIPVSITDSNGQVVYEETVPVTAFGSFSGQFDIADDAPLGYYTLIAKLPGNDNESFYQPSGTISFGVAEFRLPRISGECYSSGRCGGAG